jgi:N-formylglutamate deformylase
MEPLYRFAVSEVPVLVSVPHAGIYIPAAIASTMTPEALRVEDTDWFVDTLYNVAPSLGIGLLTATHSRYVIDLNRAPDNVSLYPGKSVTELVPTTTFANEPIYQPGQIPNANEIANRIKLYWEPYHQALRHELDRLTAKFGVAVLWDGHSIRSVVPRFFSGVLTDMNFGTAKGAAAGVSLVAAVRSAASSAGSLSAVWDSRFIGGYITRTYGKPAAGIHAIQLEMTWRSYMVEQAPYALAPDRAAKARAYIVACLRAARDWALAESKA